MKGVTLQVLKLLGAELPRHRWTFLPDSFLRRLMKFQYFLRKNNLFCAKLRAQHLDYSACECLNDQSSQE